MKKIICFLGCLMIFFLFLSGHSVLSYGTGTANQTGDFALKHTWLGGAVGQHWPQIRFIPQRVEAKTLAEISGIADQEATISGFPIKYEAEDGKLVYEAYPGFDKSKCEDIQERAWQDTKLVMNNVKEVCK